MLDVLGTLDLNVIGLTFNIVGIFYLANSIKFKRSRRALQEFFGVQKTLPLKKLRENVVRKIQIYLGFFFLFTGYTIQIAANLITQETPQESLQIKPNLLTIAAILVVSLLVITIATKVVLLCWGKWTFKRLLIEFFHEHEWELVTHTDIAKEMGELLKIPRNKDDSIEEYMLKIQKALHIKPSLEANPIKREKGLKTGKPGGAQAHRATPPRIE